MNERSRGTVKWFNDPRGYGFIVCDQFKNDIFVHYRSIRGDGFRSLTKGQAVEFKTREGEKGLQAEDVICL